MALPPRADELLACDDTLPDTLRERILERGEKARETLLLLATDPRYRGDNAP